jgi:mevalonate kinase
MDKDTDNFVDGAEDKTTSPHYQCPCQRPLCKRETNEEQFVIVWEEHKHHDKDKVRIIAKVQQEIVPLLHPIVDPSKRCHSNKEQAIQIWNVLRPCTNSFSLRKLGKPGPEHFA